MTVLIAALVIASITRVVFAADSLADQLGLKFSGGGTFILAGTPKLNVTQNDNNGENNASYSLDLSITKEFENNGRITARFKGGAGKGIARELITYATVNADADETITPEGYVHTKLTQLFYQQSFLDNKFTINFGKLSLGSYFAKNQYAGGGTSQFITKSFAADELIEKTGQAIAIRLNYAVTDKLDVDYAYFATRLNHFDAKGINILQATYKPCEKGNCRVYVWTSNNDRYSFKDLKDKSGTYGAGLSADQEINEKIGAFGRFGYKNPSDGISSVAISSTNYENIKQTVSLSWSIGVQLKDFCSVRTNDVIGFALGRMYGSDECRKCANNYKNKAETQLELYYKLVLNEYIAVTPAVQYFVNPLGGNGNTNGDNIIIYGIRTRFDF
ncbi:MAG: carbohydrate porin [Endomicrobium sp.]|nr:carbohydrate porin [Endomicrobium sp.]